jgi:hypothetical protein
LINISPKNYVMEPVRVSPDLTKSAYCNEATQHHRPTAIQNGALALPTTYHEGLHVVGRPLASP